ncbi:MAG: DNA internalization-related competence protein ComEC/Rec2 [candidate division WOR-3 bacterium]|nr:DNA internalization-related competence protein ComEC/Rec2 [candidate division WOR-3 bacterium]
MRYATLKALIAIVGGILLMQVASISTLYLLISAIVALVLGIFTKGYLLYLALFFASAINFNQQKLSQSIAASFPHFDTPLKIRLQIVEEPIVFSNRYTAKILAINNSVGFGKVFLFVKSEERILSYGDIVECESKIVPFDFPRNPNLIDYNQYYHKQGYLGNIFVSGSEIKVLKTKQGNRITQSLIIPLRQYFFKTIDTFFDADEKDLLLGFVLGEKRGMSQSMRATFADAGVAHILAISGLHMAILIGILILLLPIVGIRRIGQLVIIILITIFYLAIIGFRYSAVRAGLMAICACLGLFLERNYEPRNGLFIAGIIILLISPQALNDVSFQLSFSATLAIILITPKLYGTLKDKRMPKIIKNYLVLPLIVSFSATIGTAPILLYHFFRFPILTIWANLLIVPLVSLALPLGFLVLLLNPLFKPLAQIYANTLWLLLKLIIFISEKFANLSWQIIEPGRPSMLLILLFYLGVLVILFWKKALLRKISIAILLIGLNFEVGKSILQPNYFTITFLDLRQGDAIFLELPNRRKMLIDAGEENEIVPQFLKSKGIKSIDFAVISHPHLDHYGGFRNLLNDFKILNIIVATDKSKDTVYTNLIDGIKRKGVNVFYADRWQAIKGLGLKAEIFSPDREIRRIYALEALKINDISIVLKLEYNNISFLFPGDLDDAELIANLPVQSCILKSPHHASKKANNPLLFDIVKPEYIIITGRKKVNQEVLDLIEQYQIKSFNIRKDGALIIKIKKTKVNFERFNGQRYF